MPISRGEWYNSGSRPMMKARDGAVTADVEQGDIASCALTSGTLAAGSVTCAAIADLHVTSGKLAAGAVTCFSVADLHITSGKLAASSVTCTALADAHVTSGKLASGAVTCTAIGAAHVVSEKASENLVLKSFLIVLDPPEPSGLVSGGSSIGGWTSTYKVWRPLTPIVIERVQAFVHRAYELACNDSITLFGNSGTCIGDVYFCGQSTALAGGTRVAGSTANLVLVNLPACTDIITKWVISTCSVASPVTLQIDFRTSN